jgi:hypothetical protein
MIVCLPLLLPRASNPASTNRTRQRNVRIEPRHSERRKKNKGKKQQGSDLGVVILLVAVVAEQALGVQVHGSDSDDTAGARRAASRLSLGFRAREGGERVGDRQAPLLLRLLGEGGRTEE